MYVLSERTQCAYCTEGTEKAIDKRLRGNCHKMPWHVKLQLQAKTGKPV